MAVPCITTFVKHRKCPDLLFREHFPTAGDGGDTDDNTTASGNVTDADNDPLDFRSSLGSRDSGTVIEEAPVGGSHHKTREGLPGVSVLKRQRKKFAAKQRTLLRKMKHLKRRAVDLNEVGVARWMERCVGVLADVLCAQSMCFSLLQRVSEVVQDPQQKETVELLHQINDLGVQCICSAASCVCVWGVCG